MPHTKATEGMEVYLAPGVRGDSPSGGEGMAKEWVAWAVRKWREPRAVAPGTSSPPPPYSHLGPRFTGCCQSHSGGSPFVNLSGNILTDMLKGESPGILHPVKFTVKLTITREMGEDYSLIRQ